MNLDQIKSRCEEKASTRYHGGACAACNVRHGCIDLIAEVERLRKVEQCTKCTHDYPHRNATCPGHADAEWPCAGFESRKK